MAKLKRIFISWKMMKKRKFKLLQKIMTRKSKIQNSFLSLSLTQWRITARHITTADNSRKKLRELSIGPLYSFASEMKGEKVRMKKSESLHLRSKNQTLRKVKAKK